MKANKLLCPGASNRGNRRSLFRVVYSGATATPCANRCSWASIPLLLISATSTGRTTQKSTTYSSHEEVKVRIKLKITHKKKLKHCWCMVPVPLIWDENRIRKAHTKSKQKDKRSISLLSIYCWILQENDIGSYKSVINQIHLCCFCTANCQIATIDLYFKGFISITNYAMSCFL